MASVAAEANPNNYSCLGHLGAGKAEPGNEDHPVAYSFYCNGPISGYQLQTQTQLTGIQGQPLVTNQAGNALTDVLSCSGEVPGRALNCVGLARAGYETVTGQFTIAKRLCSEPRVDAVLTVVFAYLEKGVVTQAISGPFDLGRPLGCPKHPNSHKKSSSTKGNKAAARR